ncbi:MAG: hypothetical protein IPL08_04420 [Saprospiraceae bacterium]|nr:hypothetical protein [Saprospiraceae bacterium]
MDCGPACLKMITDHHGRSISMQKLRDKYVWVADPAHGKIRLTKEQFKKS